MRPELRSIMSMFALDQNIPPERSALLEIGTLAGVLTLAVGIAVVLGWLVFRAVLWATW